VNVIKISSNYITVIGRLMPNFALLISHIKRRIRMKKIILGLMTAILMLLFIPAHSEDNSKVNPFAKKEKIEISAEAQAMILRLEEIKAMDLTEKTKSEKKELRAEVKMIKSDLKAENLNSSGGLYISVGAAILIVLLLILLL
jgi:hypothetical protein